MAKEVDIPRLLRAMQDSRRRLERYRLERLEAVRHYVGNHYSEEGKDTKTPLNLISLYVSILGRNLIAKDPRFLLSTFDTASKPSVRAMQDWSNKQVEHIELGTTLKRIVLDAMFSIGIAKVSLSTMGDSSQTGWTLQVAEPFVQRVDLDDFAYDIGANDFREAGWMAHRFRVPLDIIRDDKDYSKARLNLTASVQKPYNEQGDQKTETIGRGSYSQEEFDDFVDLWEVWIPRERRVYTFSESDMGSASADGEEMEPLRVQDWIGPASGPYKILAYNTVPGNAMPKGTVLDLLDLHVLTNNIYRKLGRQAERQKEVLGVSGSATADGERAVVTNDGEAFRCDRPSELKPLQFGGPSQQNLAFGVHMADKFGYQAGNLDMMGGLSPQSKTLGQDRMLQENSSRAVAELQDTTIRFTAEVGKALLWYWWHDPVRVMKVNHSLPGLPEMSIQRSVGPAQRQGDFEDLDIRVDPYSMQHSTPSSRLQALNQVVQTIIIPMTPILQQQGIVFDANAYLKKVGDYTDMPDLADIITIQDPPAPETQLSSGGGDAPTMPQETTRNYVRRSLGGNTPENRQAQMMNGLMQGQPEQGAMGA